MLALGTIISRESKVTIHFLESYLNLVLKNQNKRVVWSKINAHTRHLTKQLGSPFGDLTVYLGGAIGIMMCYWLTDNITYKEVVAIISGLNAILHSGHEQPSVFGKERVSIFRRV